jgi:L-2-hydroxyglutarate oxidase LhgO
VGSLKARYCVAGKEALYRYCAEHGIAHRRCGKIIVATAHDQLAALHEIKDRAAQCGVGDLEILDAAQAVAMEPALRCHGALYSPSTGIIDSHGLMLELQGDAEAAGAMLAFLSPVLGGAVRNDGIELDVGGEIATSLQCRVVVNCAGLYATDIAGTIDGMPEKLVPRTYYTKGNYYSLTGTTPFSRLVYPAPTTEFLGVHITIDIAGQARFGPDVEQCQAIDYNVDPRRADGFYQAVRRYWPGLRDGALQPAYSGIRPRISAPGDPVPDFCIQGPGDHGVAGLVNLFGIESPGLTAAMPIADHVANLLSEG